MVKLRLKQCGRKQRVGFYDPIKNQTY
nr:ribosomal protein S16 [Swertia banzragczii]WON66480.1 ribosomal protein S16 [Swertia banzragczii]